nr:ribonuclease hi [Quercus suber]
MVASDIIGLHWEVYIDEASNPKGAGIEIVLITPKKLIMEKSLRLGFLATNNEAKYEALLTGVVMVRQLGGDVVEFYSDSWLVVGQVKGEFEARDERMQEYLAKVQHARSQFKSFVLKQIPRGQNSHVDSLAMLATYLGSSLP